MTQLIENKPRRRALIATLLHFSPRRRGFVGRSFSSDITDDARSAYRCQSFADGAAQVPGEGSLGDKSSAACTDSCLFIALISNRRCCRLEFDVTACKQTTACVSNRRKSATYAYRRLSFISALTFGFKAKGVAFEFEEERDGD
jgi:hypothetical protein